MTRKPRMSVPASTLALQREASDPEHSAWVRANAGAGKTYVLAQRVLRLLLAGTDPSRILCITYTKAAAAEMANRVFAWLGEWTTLPETDLKEALCALQDRPPSAVEMLRARRLFAAAIETPGRLRVQTIHAFCERVLQQFPFEASVTAGFSVIDERAAAELLAEARSSVITEAAGHPHVAPGRSLDRLAMLAGDDGIDKLLRGLVGLRGTLAAWIRDHDDLDGALDRLAIALGMGPGDDEASLCRAMLDGPVLPRSEWTGVAATIDRGSSNDRKRAEALREAATASDPQEAVERYATVFLTGKGDPRSSVVTKAISDPYPELAARLDNEKARVHGLVDRLKAAGVHARTETLLRFADAVLDRYESLKAVRGLLDYDDLIDRTVALLTRADTGWVLYKLDGGLDHVLVDEAQDTSPRQWQVVGAIVDEFFSGDGARDGGRTLFVVGDPKQSIYSFQGADPGGFGTMRRRFAARTGPSSRPLADVRLALSFRSTPAVLGAVDRVFASESAAAGLYPDGEAETIAHAAIRDRDAGRVELWPLEAADRHEPPPPWDAPFDVERPGSAQARLARRVAATIRRWFDEGERLDATGEPIRAGDIMILLRTRAPFAEPMIRALKEAGVAVAGADRMVLTAHIAVMDLMAVGRFALLPEDDLTLAALLKSPLVGLDEDALMTLSAGRPGSLWATLEARAVERPDWGEARDRLAAWRGRAGYERPYEFYARILGADGGRRAFTARLGREALDALDEFLSAALAHERGETPTLAGFLAWLDAAAADVKRDMDQGRDEVRVMTVHGAKGLEAPIVFLPDTCRAPRGKGAGPLVPFAMDGGGADALVWLPAKTDDCGATRRLRDAANRRQEEEEHRLLYVAMTRARDRLYVCGYEGGRPAPDGCWYSLVGEALSSGGLTPMQRPDGTTVGVLDSGLAPAAPAPSPAPEASPEPLPAWTGERRRFETAERRISPSHIADHRAPAASSGPGGVARRRDARERGIVMHRLLQSLPNVAPDQRREAGARALEVAAPRWDRDERGRAVDEIMRVLETPAFAAAFAPGARSEVSVAGRVPGHDGLVTGQIDRLVVTDGEVLIVDYKTDRLPPASVGDVPEAYLAQLAAYSALIAPIHPGRLVRCALLWTATPALMDVTQAIPGAHGAPADA